MQDSLSSFISFRIVPKVMADLLGYTYTDMVGIYNVTTPYIPQEYKDEMQGIAGGSEMSYEQITALCVLDLIFRDTSCSGAALWGSATQDGKLYLQRSNDMHLDTRTQRQKNVRRSYKF